jgi:hypothetical protein
MPVRAANNTPAGDLIGLAANAPEEATLRQAATPESSSDIAPSELVPAEALVRQDDLMPEVPSCAVSTATIWGPTVLAVLLHVAVLR